ncbi:MAG TPA: hypothetical protein VFE33_20980 [Thermoanaerobaculia bacterium]|nr:hypothetical protein [Thermoanaerobaculia bacterium]
MPKCFLSYGSAYRHLVEPVRRLLQVLEFEVDLSDEPDLERTSANIVQSRIAAADAVVVLLGPAERSTNGGSLEPARWPNEECIYALTLKKPLAIFRHLHTRLPEIASGLQTPAVFDFWDPASFQSSVHHVVKHLQDLRRQFDLPPGNQLFVFTKGVVRNRVQRSALFVQVYHEAVVRQAWESFHHALDTGLDHSESATIQLVSDEVDIDAPLGGELHRPVVRFGKRTPKEIEYFVDVKPGLAAGEKYGYRREFELQNWFPLTRAELEARAGQEGFPEQYRQDGRLYYGDSYDVLFEMDSILLVFHFPWKVKLAGLRALALPYGARQINKGETDRCNNREALRLEENAQDGERTLSLEVRRPLINHSYALLYELAE